MLSATKVSYPEKSKGYSSHRQKHIFTKYLENIFFKITFLDREFLVQSIFYSKGVSRKHWRL